MKPQNTGAPDETPQKEEVSDEPSNEVSSSEDDPIGTRIVIFIAAMVVVMFFIALGFLYEVARRRPG